MQNEFELMMKCDMCYDRTSAGLRPMCATVCPSQALFFGTREEIERLRPRSTPVNQFRFGQQVIQTRVNMMTPRAAGRSLVDVTEAMNEQPVGRSISLDVLSEMELSSTLEVMG
jgi:Fe-S-cluster-containing dehydrogenase component